MLIVGSCVPPESDSFVTYKIINDSQHKVMIRIYQNDLTIKNIDLPETGNDTTFQGYQEGQVADPPPFLADSVKVVYDDSIFIFHFRYANQTASRSILLSSSWNGGKIEKSKYDWKYIFTNEDYLEALENQ